MIEHIEMIEKSQATDCTVTVLPMQQLHGFRITFKGDEQLTVATFNVGASAKIDASEMTDKFIMTTRFTGDGPQLVLGGSAADTLISNNVIGSTIQGNGGADTITLNASGPPGRAEIVTYVAQSDSTLSAFDKIANFRAGEDTIDLSAFGFTGPATTALIDHGTLANVDPGSAASANFFNDGVADRAIAIADLGLPTHYVYVDINGDGDFAAADDLVIELTGPILAPGIGDFTF